jgi:hypothetical protein
MPVRSHAQVEPLHLSGMVVTGIVETDSKRLADLEQLVYSFRILSVFSSPLPSLLSILSLLRMHFPSNGGCCRFFQQSS